MTNKSKSYNFQRTEGERETRGIKTVEVPFNSLGDGPSSQTSKKTLTCKIWTRSSNTENDISQFGFFRQTIPQRFDDNNGTFDLRRPPGCKDEYEESTQRGRKLTKFVTCRKRKTMLKKNSSPCTEIIRRKKKIVRRERLSNG